MSDVFPKWPHLENLDRVLKDVPDYLDMNMGLPGIATYTVTEKVHGFNARFGRTLSDVPWIGSRNLEVAVGLDVAESPDGGLQGFVGFAKGVLPGVNRGETFFGEWAGKGVQKGIDYGDREFYAFGYMLDGELQSFEALQNACAELGIKTVPVVQRFYGAKPTLTDLQVLRDEQSVLAKTPSKGEGIVIYPFPPTLDVYGHVVIAKYKTADFEERTRFRAPNGEEPDLTKVTGFVADYVNEVRLGHVLDRVYEEVNVPGQTNDDPREVQYTGHVMRAMVEDVMREGKADFDALPESEQKQVNKVINRLTKELLLAARDKAMLGLAK